MDRNMILAFFDCGDDQIIQFAIQRAHLNTPEKKVLQCIVDDRLTQEETAEIINYSVRHTQDIWYSAVRKLLNIPWVKAYAEELLREKYSLN